MSWLIDTQKKILIQKAKQANKILFWVKNEAKDDQQTFEKSYDQYHGPSVQYSCSGLIVIK